MVEVSGEVWESVARWLELTGLTKALWRLREPKPLSRAFATRNTRYVASALERLGSARGSRRTAPSCKNARGERPSDQDWEPSVACALALL